MLDLKKLGEQPGFLPGFLSFCLPGLGQMYQKRAVPAALGILPFWFLLAAFPGYPWPLLLSAAFGWEAFRWGMKHPRPTEDRRGKVYAVTAIASFCFWSMLVSPAALRLQEVARRNANAQRNDAAYKECVRSRGRDRAAYLECDRLFESNLSVK